MESRCGIRDDTLDFSFICGLSENEEVLYRTGRLVSHLSGRIVLQIARTMKNIDLERRQYYGRDRRNPVQGNEWRTDTSLRGRDERGEDTGVPEPLRQDRSTGNEENGPGTIRNDAPVRETDGAAYEKYLEKHPLSDQPVTITYERNGLEYEVEITPREYRTPVTGFGYNTYSEKTSGFNVLKYGAVEVKYMIRTTILSLKELVSGHLGMKDLSGPVGVVDAIGDTYEQSRNEGTLMIWMNMLNMAVLLSANLGVMNLLPIPALDGGRLVFLLAEAIRRKPVNRQIEGMVHFAGLMLLMALMVVVMYNDILKIF